MTDEEVRGLLAEQPPNTRVKIDTCIYGYRTVGGELRFQLRHRRSGRGGLHAGTTFATLARARAERDRRAAREPDHWTVGRYALEQWWPELTPYLEPSTLLLYEGAVERDVMPFWEHVPLREVDREQVKRYTVWLRRHKTTIRKQQEHFAEAAYEEALETLNRIVEHAVEEEVLPFNPVTPVLRKDRKRRKGGKGRREAGGGREGRPIRVREALSPLTVERIRLAIAGRGMFTLRYRALVSVLAYLGLRPGEALGLRYSDLLGLDGPLGYVSVERARKDIAGYTLIGSTKTDIVRDIKIWPAVLEELLELYAREGRPPLSTFVFRGLTEMPFDLNNWRDRPWYSALQVAGLTEERGPKVEGAIVPYTLRHSCATIMLHCQRHDVSDRIAGYSHKEIARQLGHSEKTLIDVYSGVLDDIHNVAGRTMEQMIRNARRQIWGALPGDDDYREQLLTVAQAAGMIGLTPTALHSRIANGSIPASEIDGLKHVLRADLLLHGLDRVGATIGR